MKKNTGWKRFLFWGVALLIVVYFLLPEYAQRALIYTAVGIDDYTIFENRPVKAGAKSEWPVDSLYAQMHLSDSLLAEIESYDPVAFLVLKNGKILYEHYWDNYGPESLSNSFSMAKSIVSLLVGAAIDDGFIQSVDDPVSKYISAFDNENNRMLTIRDVLTMSSGLNWDESYGSLFSTTTEAYYGTDLKSLIYNLKVVETPAKTFKYLSGNTQLLAMVLEEATGEYISDYASRKFWKPMGAEHDALWCLDREEGMEKAYCCFNSNARDFARWGQLILNKGRWNGQQLVSASYVEEAISPATYLLDEEGNAVDFYGFQWWIHHTNGWQVPYMRGILGQYVFVIPSENAVVVRLGHKRSKKYLRHHPEDTYLYLDAALDLFQQYKLHRGAD